VEGREGRVSDAERGREEGGRGEGGEKRVSETKEGGRDVPGSWPKDAMTCIRLARPWCIEGQLRRMREGGSEAGEGEEGCIDRMS